MDKNLGSFDNMMDDFKTFTKNEIDCFNNEYDWHKQMSDINENNKKKNLGHIYRCIILLLNEIAQQY